MNIIYEKEIEKLNQQLLVLSGKVEQSMIDACRAIFDRDVNLANQVIQGDLEIDRFEVDVEEECLKLLALHQPVAKDLRYLITALKINNDLERIGDIGKGLAKRALLFAEDPSFEIPEKLNLMAEKTREMLRNSIDALINHDGIEAAGIRGKDDIVDELNREIYLMVKEAITTSTDHAASWVHLLTCARQLERAADLVTNISEDTLYLFNGEIVRHAHASQ